MSGRLTPVIISCACAVLSTSPTLAQETPPTPPPSAAPSAEPPPPPAAVQAAPDGQWVFTNQYGWVFMPYAETYTYVPAAGDALAYVYGPAFGWRWLSAPWVFGLGPRPFWGPRGDARFVWRADPSFTHRAFVAHAAAPHSLHMHFHGHHR